MDTPSGGQPRPEERASHDFRTDRSLSTTVVLAVSRARGVEPTELPPLAEVIDPDALDALFAPDGRDALIDVRLRFEFADRTVCVRRGGEVLVRPLVGAH